MNTILSTLCRVYFWRPAVWKKYIVAKRLRKDMTTLHSQMKSLSEKFMSIIANGELSESGINRLSQYYFCIKSAWHRISELTASLERLQHKLLRPSPQEVITNRRYREEAYQMFYDCSIRLVDAELKTGQVNHAERVAFLKHVIRLRDC